MQGERLQKKRPELVPADTHPSWSAAARNPVVLIVDDEDGIRDFLRSAFETEGYTVLAAADGEAALMLCEHLRPDIILLDLMMPRLDGLGFLHEFRRRYGFDTCPTYIMSAVGTAVEHAEAAGVTGAIVKPFDLEAVLEMAARSIGHPYQPATPARWDGRRRQQA